MRRQVCVWVAFCFLSFPIGAESFRALVSGEIELSAENPEGSSLNLSYNSSALIRLGRDSRFFRGIEIELTAPQIWLAYRGSLAMQVYAELNRLPALGTNDLNGRRIAFDPLPNRIKTVYQIPLRLSHGLRTTPYTTVATGITFPTSFPVLFALMPIIKGLSEDFENMQFILSVKPILSDEGAARLIFRYPDQLKDRPFTVLIDDVVITNIDTEMLLKEGEHHLVVLSDDYRNENRRFVMEKAKRKDIIIVLQDPTPLVVFEAPENALIFLNNVPILREIGPIPVEPGVHEAKFQVGDYTLTKTITVNRGKTYRVALAVGIDIEENE
jgi:hypothetical protein